MKNITVVAGKSLKKQAIKLVHCLSKLDDAKAVYWTPKQFRDNEANVTGKSPAVFIGRTKETEPYTDLIKPMKNMHGVIWGYDGSKAAIIIENKPDDIDALSKDIDRLSIDTGINIDKKTVKKLANKPPAWFAAVNLALYSSQKIANDMVIKKCQYIYGMLSFVSEGLDMYLDAL